MVNHILIIEDEEVIRVTLKMLLELEGYDVLAVENGREALCLLETGFRPSLILLDLLMPVMSGNRFLKIKESSKELAAIPVCVISGALELPQPNGEFEILKKPIQYTDLLEIVKKYE